jgi:hypothetical protein
MMEFQPTSKRPADWHSSKLMIPFHKSFPQACYILSAVEFMHTESKKNKMILAGLEPSKGFEQLT